MRIFKKQEDQDEKLLKIQKDMSKKRKLNSNNPKYWDKSQLNEKPIAKKVLYKNTKGIKVYGVWYK